MPVSSIIAGIIGLFLGVILGSLLGRVGALKILAFILRIPTILIKSPKQLKSKWKMWQELRDSRKIERLERNKEMNVLKDEIKDHKGQINKIKAKIRRVRWEFQEPKPR